MPCLADGTGMPGKSLLHLCRLYVSICSHPQILKPRAWSDGKTCISDLLHILLQHSISYKPDEFVFSLEVSFMDYPLWHAVPYVDALLQAFTR